jgi:hypothetical protein
MRPFPLMAVFELPICPQAEHISFCDMFLLIAFSNKTRCSGTQKPGHQGEPCGPYVSFPTQRDQRP